MRYKFNKILTASLMACLILGSFIFNACSKEDNVSIIKLTAFGPSPALRGGELKFIGTSLDQVTSIVLDGGLEITEITKTSPTEISILIPQTAKPGLVVLKTPQGDITTKTPLTFSEPILIATYTTASVKAGDEFTITGDYLNLIAKVIFTDGAVIDSSKFISQSRKELKVYVPKAAKTGKVTISNGAAIPVLVKTIGDATISDPSTLVSISPIPVKPGANLTITGTYLDLVKTVVLPDGNKIDSAAITINGAKTEIVVKVPLTAKEGTVKLVTYSGHEISSTVVMKLTSPSITSVSPMLLKNGATLTVKGTNLDLVTGVTFTDGVAGKLGTLSSDNTSLDIIVPLTAKDGPVILGTNSGLIATSAAITLVKPTFISISPLALTAGETVTITGTDLDLVNKVDFMGGSVTVTPPSGATSLAVTVPTTCSGTGSITLETVNGSKVVSSDQLSIKAATTPAIIGITPGVAPGGLMTITGKNLNYVESIYFENDVKAVLYGVRTETSITVYIPKEAKHGKITFTMNSFVGEKIVSPIFAYGTDPIVDPSLVIFNFEDRNGNNSANNAGSWGGIANGKSTAGDGVSGDFFEITASNWNSGAYWWVADNWVEKPYPIISNTNNYVIKMDIRLRQDIPVDDQVQIKLMLSGEKQINFIPYLPVVNNKYSTGGEWVTITLPTTGLSDPTVDSGSWGIISGWNPHAVNFTGFCVDNIRYEKISSGSGVSQFKLIGM